MNDIMLRERPASFFSEPWRDATPLGNGLTGALVYGGAEIETILLNRYDLWHFERLCPVPDVSADFAHMRACMERGEYTAAKSVLSDALKAHGYSPDPGVPCPVGVLRIQTSPIGMFKHYRRTLRMDTGEYALAFDEGENRIASECFISRVCDVLYYRMYSQVQKRFTVTFSLHDDGTPNTARTLRELEGKYSLRYRDGHIFFLAENHGLKYGAVVKVVGGSCDEDRILANGSELCLAVKCFSGRTELTEEIMEKELAEAGADYDAELARHTDVHKKLYESVELSLYDGAPHTNEQLLAAAYEDEASPELIERIWKFGRYLFISGTNENGLPFPLYGLWHGEYAAPWAQNVANINVEMIYWHCLNGSLYGLMRPLIRYYCEDLEPYREYAAKLFGCRGIFLSVYSTPVCMQPAPVVPVIVNYIGVAGWLGNLFYKYYKLSGDTETLEKYIYPFLCEAAAFYCDYITYDENGCAVIAPSVSPENSPRNFVPDKHAANMEHPMPTAKNATMDFAIVKELLTNLIELAETARAVKPAPEALCVWKETLRRIPGYKVNADGAIAEWMSDEFEDNYFHRHLSHIYPVYPGKEIGFSHPLLEAFKKAVELRVLQGQSGWSLMHMAAIYACLQNADGAIECFDVLGKGCMADSFMTLHNDYRHMGVTLEYQFAPMQLDAAMGAVNALQLMLFNEQNGTLCFLPALPARLKRGSVRGLSFVGGEADVSWDENGFCATVRALRAVRLKLVLPEGDHAVTVGEKPVPHDENNEYVLNVGDTLRISARSGCC